MNAQQYTEILLNFTKEAGVIALDFFDKSEPQLKGDASVLTKGDLAISRLANEHLADLLKTKEHILIDEEDPNSTRYLNEETFRNTPYIWALDPIDGTRPYANRTPLYGISLGLLKDAKPWLGAVYCPSLKELFYCDGTHAYFVKDPFTPEEVRIKIQPPNQTINSRSIFMAEDEICREYQWDYKDCQLMISACTLLDMCWPAIGRACGGLIRSNIWDIAGSWPISLAAGLELRTLNSKEEVTGLDSRFFNMDNQPWKLKDYVIVSSNANYAPLREKILGKE